MKRFIIFTVLFFGLTNSAIGQEVGVTTLLAQGKQYFNAKEYEKASVVFQQAFLNNPADLDISFFMGRAAFEQAMLARTEGKDDLTQKRLEAALMAFDRVLIMDPAAVRVKLEIARCHMQLGSYQLARQYFYEVLHTNPPEPVIQNINIYLASMKALEKKHYINGSVSVGISADNNVYSAPGDYLLTFPGSGGDITVPASSEPLADFIYTIIASLSHIYKFEESPYSWKTSIIDLNSLYNQYADLDIHLLGITTGPTYQKNNFFLEAHTSLNTLTLGRAGYVQPTSIGGSAGFLLGPRFLISTSLQFEKKEYKKETDKEKDATNIHASLSPSLSLGKNRLTGTVSKERENADAASFSYDRIQWAIRLDRLLTNSLTFYANYDFKTTDYDAIRAGDIVIRSDEIKILSLGFNKIVWKSKDKSKNISAFLTYTYTDSDSNVAIYTYDKTATTITVSYNF